VEAAHLLAAGDASAAWHAASAAPDDAGPYLLGRIGEALGAHGHVRDSVRAYGAALRLTPGDPDLRDAREAAAGEWRVLAGGWTPPELPAVAGEPDPDRVLHVVGPSLPGVQSGYTFRTHAIVRAQRASGADASAVTEPGFPGDGAPTPAGRIDTVDGVPYHRLAPGCEVPIRLDDRLTAHARALHRLVRDGRPAVLHAASDFRNALPALAAGRAAGVPVIYEMRGFWEDTWRAGLPEAAVPGERYARLRERELACALAADAVVTLSGAMRDDLIARGVPAGRIEVIPNGVDADAFRPRPRDADLAARLGLAASPCVVGYVSTLNGYEGIDVLLHALARLVRRGVDVSGLVVGDGPDRARLEALAADLAIAGRVRFAGRVPHADIARWYSLLDIFVVPRLDRRVARLVTPLKPLEAMAMAVPVVASDLPALRELVEDDRTGRLAPAGDADGLASTLAPLIAAPVLRRRLGDAGRAFVLRSRTWSHVGCRALDLHRRLAPAPAGKGLPL
jgi:PEP-CTERM/exosortase A-associated glycosyltransferase